MVEIIIPDFYEYLKKQKNLEFEKLSDAELDLHRKGFARYRNKLYKQRQRIEKREISIFLNSNEYTTLNHQAKEHNLNLATYTKQAALKYATRTYMTPNRTQLVVICQLLQSIEKKIEELSQKKKSIFFQKDLENKQLISLIEEFRGNLLSQITKPTHVEDWIFNQLQNNPEFKKKLLQQLLSEL